MTLAMCGRVRRNGAEDLVFSHPLMSRRVSAKATRRETSDALIVWLRHLSFIRARLRAELGFPPEVLP